MNAKKYIPEKKESQFLKASEIIESGKGGIGSGWTLKIREAQGHELKDFKTQEMNQKMVLLFEGKDKGVVLNTTNLEMVIDLFGEETDDWVGHSIRLSIIQTEKGPGFCVKPVRVNKPAPVPAPKPQPKEEDLTRDLPGGDEIPF